MDLTLTEDQELVQSTAREFLASKRAGADARAVAGDPLGYSAALWKEMTDLGWTGLAVAEQYGGVGQGFLELCLLIEEMARAQVPSPFLTSAACCGMAISRYGSEEQKREWLGEICRGRIAAYAGPRAAFARPSAAYAGTSPRRGPAGAGPEVTATADSDGFVLDGQAPFVPYAHAADDLLVAARLAGAQPAGAQLTGAEVGGAEVGGAEVGGAEVGGAEVGGAEVGGAEVGGAEVAGARDGSDRDGSDGDGSDGDGSDGDGLTVFLVGASSPGISRHRLTAVGTDRMCRVGFDRVQVPGARVLGGPGQAGAGRPAVEAVSAYGAAATCAALVGDAQGVLDATIEYAGQREQFGQPIGAFQAVAHHCADMAIDVLSSRLIAYEAIWRLSRDLEAATEVSVAKSWVSEACQRVCALGHQVHGAVGFTMEHNLHGWLRHATASALSFGDATFHTGQIATSLGL